MLKRNQFTLLELLIVVAIIAILISILLPSLGKAREQAKLAVCLSNNRQLNIMSQSFSNSNDYILPSQSWRSKEIRGKFWMVQINPEWDEMGDIDVTGTAFECSTFRDNKAKWLGPSVSEARLKGCGGIGYNRFIGNDADKRYGRDRHNPTMTMLQVVQPSQTIMFNDTKNSARGSGGPDWQIQALNWAGNDTENYIQRHIIGKGMKSWRTPTSWVDGSAKVMSVIDYHAKERFYTLINAVRE